MRAPTQCTSTKLAELIRFTSTSSVIVRTEDFVMKSSDFQLVLPRCIVVVTIIMAKVVYLS
jgi:hypothetical protein